MAAGTPQHDWRTKPTDRFILKWIKIHLSAPLTRTLVKISWLRPGIVTCISAGLGTAAGIVFAGGWGWLAGVLAAVGQILDGVDGQLARLTRRESAAGAYLDSLLDRYADGAMMIGTVIYVTRLPGGLPLWLILVCGGLALLGGNLISYSTARAASLHIKLGPPTRASKGTRMSVMIICALGSSLWPPLPLFALIYLALHTNLTVVGRIRRAYHQSSEHGNIRE
jgi:phosphatidylglycerophosphate synthase